MKKSRPINLDLTTMHFPITAVVSILHRISGVVIFLAIPFMLWFLSLSLTSLYSFQDARIYMGYGCVKLAMWLCLSALSYHAIAGIKHLLMDIGCGEKRQSARMASYVTLGLIGVVSLMIGLWLW